MKKTILLFALLAIAMFSSANVHDVDCSANQSMAAKSASALIRTAITDQPIGELKTYTRSGQSLISFYGYIYAYEQSGTVNVVFADDGTTVFLQDIMFGLQMGTWVQGTLVGNTIQVPMGQELGYNDLYGANVSLGWATTSATEENGTLNLVCEFDDSKQFATFTIDGNTITLDNSYGDVTNSDPTVAYAGTGLAARWTADGTWAGYIDFSTVLTQTETLYNLWINGTQVSESNAADLSVIDGVEGTVSYDPSVNILTLKDATMSVAYANNIKNSTKGLKIIAEGDNTLEVTWGANGSIYAEKDLTVEGTGTLNLSSAANPGISVGEESTITLQGGIQVNSSGTYGLFGMNTTAQMVMNGADTKLTAHGSTVSFYRVKATLNDGIEITQPSGVMFNEYNTVVNADGSYVKNEDVVFRNPVLTGADRVEAGKAVAGIRYYNIAGQEVATSSGLTIQVTTYSDGTTQAVKVMK